MWHVASGVHCVCMVILLFALFVRMSVKILLTVFMAVCHTVMTNQMAYSDIPFSKI